MHDDLPSPSAPHPLDVATRPQAPHFEELQTTQPPAPQRPFYRRHWKLLVACGAGCFFVVGAMIAYGARQSPTADTLTGEPLSFFSSLKRLGQSERGTDAEKNDDQVNILLLGIGGAGHEGSQLTDTIMLGRYQPSTGLAGIISIPRDLGVRQEHGNYIKINAVNAYAEQDKEDSGLEASAAVIEDIFSIPIDAVVRVDFHGFEEVIDAIGGIDVNVDRAFIDSSYPVDGMEDADCSSGQNVPEETTSAEQVVQYNCRFEVLSFNAGPMHMDGSLALKFARSRHGTNGEGSDFARAARQQKILLAVKEKILSPSVLLNPKRLNDVISVIQRNVTTNLTIWKMASYARDAANVAWDSLRLKVIDGASGLVYQTTIGGAYMLLPIHEDWADFAHLADTIFTPTNDTTSALSSAASGTIAVSGIPTGLSVRVEVQNGTTQTGIAAKTAQILESSGITVTDIGNTRARDWEETVIYDMTGGAKQRELSALAKYFHATVAQDLPEDRVVVSGNADFVLVLGSDFGQIVMK